MGYLGAQLLNPLAGEVAFLPSDIPGLMQWLTGDAETWQDAAMTVPAATGGDVIGGWADQSGNGNDVIQATTAKKPIMKVTGNGINNLPIVRFDGTDDMLANASAFLTGANGAVFVVCRLRTPLVENANILSSADEASTGYYVLFRPYGTAGSPNMQSTQRNNDTSDRVRGDTVISADVVYIMLWSSNGAAYEHRVNGVDQTLTVVSGANNGDWFGDTSARDNVVVGILKRTGEDGPLRGDVAEVLVYDGVTLAAGEISSIEAYLAAKWGVTLP